MQPLSNLFPLTAQQDLAR